MTGTSKRSRKSAGSSTASWRKKGIIEGDIAPSLFRNMLEEGRLPDLTRPRDKKTGKVSGMGGRIGAGYVVAPIAAAPQPPV